MPPPDPQAIIFDPVPSHRIDSRERALDLALQAARGGGGLLAVVPLVLWWAVWRGGLATTLVAPGLLWLTACGLVLHATVPARMPSRAGTVALVGLGVLAVLSGASTLWATDHGAATDATLRLAVGAGAFALVLLWPPSPRTLRALVLVVPLAAVAGLASGLIGALDDPAGLIDGRLSGPTDYPNATALLCVMGAIPAVLIAADPGRSPFVRTTMTGVAAALIGGAVLPQSRSVLLLGLVLAAAVLVVAPFRIRFAAFGAVAALLAAGASPVLVDVRRAALAEEASPARPGALAVVLLLVAGIACGAGLLRLERSGTIRRVVTGGRARLGMFRPRPRPPDRRRRLRIAALVAALAVAVAVVGTTMTRDVTAIGHPDYDRIESSGTRFSAGLSSNRPDYWRVAVDLAVEHPLQGVGAGNFAGRYLGLRRASTTPEAAHSTWLGTAAELGLPGLLALVAAAGACAVAVVRRFRETAGSGRAVVLAASAPAVILAVDSGVDWTARMPVLALLALAPVAAVVATPIGSTPSPLGPGPPAGSSAPVGATPPATVSDDARARTHAVGPQRAARVTSALLVLALVAATIAGARPFLAARHSEQAVSTWHSAPDRADAELRRAATLVPHDARPVIQRGVLDVSRGRWAEATAAMEEAIRRDPRTWYPQLAIAAIAAHTGDRARAAAALRAVDARIAHGRLTNRVRGLIAAGSPVDPRDVQRWAFRQGP